MKLLYGIQGTGNGHISRSTRIIDCLQKQGVEVDVIFSGRDVKNRYDSDIIKSPRFFKGFTFKVNRGGIQFFKTIKHLSLSSFYRDVQNFDASSYDIVITDFEPVSAWVAKVHKKHCIGIGHQYAFLHDIPMDRKNPLSKWILRFFAPADISIGMHWCHFNRPIVPPVIPEGIDRPGSTKDHTLVLVYLPFEDRLQVRDLLLSFKDITFSVYAGEKGEKGSREHNIVWHPFSKAEFYNDLARCSGVICNAGFELPSEALSLGKKILVKPVKGQFEQVSNAMALTMLNLGQSMKSLDRDHIKTWLSRKDAPKMNFSNVAEHIAMWIAAGDLQSTDRLVKRTWGLA